MPGSSPPRRRSPRRSRVGASEDHLDAAGTLGLDAAREYIKANDPGAAVAVVERIEGAVDALRTHPRLGKPGRISGTRELVVRGTPFIVPYRVRGRRVTILAVIHGARRWPDRFGRSR